MRRLTVLLLLAIPGAFAADSTRVARLLDRAIIVDLHDDTTQMILDEG